MKDKNTKRFPPSSYQPHPLGVEGVPNSIYISDPTDLPTANFEEEKIYFDFFKNIDANLADRSRTNNLELSNWIASLKQSTKILEIHDQTFFNNNSIKLGIIPDFPTYVISFDDNIHLQLLPKDSIPDNLPDALVEVYRFGRLWINGGFSSSGYFYHPERIKKAVEEEWLSEYITDTHYEKLNYPINDLMVFYTDSGCWLMYDQDENVYCGGVECGDFYKSSKSINEVISIIFSKLLKNESLTIEEFAPKNEA